MVNGAMVKKLHGRILAPLNIPRTVKQEIFLFKNVFKVRNVKKTQSQKMLPEVVQLYYLWIYEYF